MKQKVLILTRFITSKPHLLFFISLLLLSLFWYVGQGWVYVVFVPALFVYTLKFPKILSSFFSRYIASLLLLYGLVQLSSVSLFLLGVDSNFNFVVGVNFILAIGLMMILGVAELTRKSIVFFNKSDLLSVLAASLVFVPLAILALGPSAWQSYIGGIQGVDGVNHFIFTSILSASQHLDYSPGSYYPSGFHIATAFLQNALGLSAEGSTWAMNARLYFWQYAGLGSVLVMSVMYLMLSILSMFGRVGIYVKIGCSIALSAAIGIFYVSNFVYNGFLSYFYIIAVIAYGAIYLLDVKKTGLGAYVLTPYQRLVGMLLITLGASLSWPLLTPVLLLTAALYFIKYVKKQGMVRKSKELITIAVLCLAHLSAVYFQLRYSPEGADGISLTGGITVLHTPFILAGLVAFIYLFARVTRISKTYGAVLLQVYLPIMLLVAGLAAFHYFTLGEVRYYAIKTAYLLEIFLVVAIVVSLVIALQRALQRKDVEWYSVIVVPFVTLVMIFGLLSLSVNPLQDLRNMGRNYSGIEEPAHFNTDTSRVAALGEAGQLEDNGVLSLHANDEGVLYTHMQGYYWGVVMAYKGGEDIGFERRYCADEVYKILFQQDFSVEMQDILKIKIEECATIESIHGSSLFIVTDKASEAVLRSTFSDSANIRYIVD